MTGRLRLLPRLALRNVRRQARRSLLTAAAMVIGVALLVFSRALGDGAHQEWIDAAVRLGAGHVALQAPGFAASRTLEDRLSPDAVRRARALIEAPDVAAAVGHVAPRLEVQALASAASGAVPVMIVGVDPAVEREFSRLDGRLIAGRYLQAGDRLHAYVGERLMDRLHLELGSRVVLTAQDAAGDIAGQLVRVVGVFRTGLPEADEGLVQIPLVTVQQWLGSDGAVTTLAVLLRSSWDVPRILRRLEASRTPADSALVALGWRRTMPELDAAIRVDDYGDYVFHIVLFAIIVLAIVNTVLMSVLYRTREFGVLRALGLTSRETAALVFTEGMMLTIASGFLGMILGFAVTWVFFRHGLDYSGLLENEFTFSGVVLEPVIIPVFRVVQLVQSMGSILAVGTLASLYPAFRATRIDVAEAMKFEA